MKKGGSNGGGVGGVSKKVGGSLSGAPQQTSVVATLQAEAVRQQQVVSTTFIEADTSSFRELVQKLTGVSEDAQEKLPITLPSRHASRESSSSQRDSSGVMWQSPRESIPVFNHIMPHRDGVMSNFTSPECANLKQGTSQREASIAMFEDRAYVSNTMSPEVYANAMTQEAYANWERMIAERNFQVGLSMEAHRANANVEPLAVRRSAFKMHDKRPLGKKLELKQGATLRRDGGGNALFSSTWNGHHVLSPKSEIERSPVTPLTRDPFDSQSYGPATPTSYDSGTTVSTRMGPEVCSPNTLISGVTGYDTCYNILRHLDPGHARSAMREVAQEFASCNMGPNGIHNGRSAEQREQEFVLHPPLEGSNGEPKLLVLFPLHSSHATEM